MVEKLYSGKLSSKCRNQNYDRIIFAHNTKIKSEKLGHSIYMEPMEWAGEMDVRIITILLLLPWSIVLCNIIELTSNPSRKIIFSY